MFVNASSPANNNERSLSHRGCFREWCTRGTPLSSARLIASAVSPAMPDVAVVMTTESKFCLYINSANSPTVLEGSTENLEIWYIVHAVVLSRRHTWRYADCRFLHRSRHLVKNWIASEYTSGWRVEQTLCDCDSSHTDNSLGARSQGVRRRSTGELWPHLQVDSANPEPDLPVRHSRPSELQLPWRFHVAVKSIRSETRV